MDKNVKLNLMSKTNIQITDLQLSFLFDKFQKISYLESKLDIHKLDISPNTLVMSLLERESIDSSIIEGTQTNHEEMYYDIVNGIRDSYSWDVRNLINLYKSAFRDIKDEILDYSVDDLKAMHRDLFKREIEGFDNKFNPVEIIKKVKPGVIVENDDNPNWIGPKGAGIEHATLILIKPSQKIEYLKDIFDEIRKNKGRKDIKTLIKFHPFFEAVHPFADGNGRLGRLLLVNLFSYLGFSSFNWIFISDTWRKDKKEYIEALHKVQTTNDWTDWVYFFVGSLRKAVDSAYSKLNSILNLYLEIKDKFNLEHEIRILKYFFQFPILNKNKTINHIVEKYNIPQTTAYRSFNNVSKKINAEKSADNTYRFTKMLEIISK